MLCFLTKGEKFVYVQNGADDLSFAFFYIISASELFYKQRQYSKEHKFGWYIVQHNYVKKVYID